MITPIKSTLELCNNIMSNPKYVEIDYNTNISYIQLDIVKFRMYRDNITTSEHISQIDILKVLLNCSIDYCFWYGTSNIRPNGLTSEKLWDIINTQVDEYYTDVNIDIFNSKSFGDQLCNVLTLNRFPLLEDRIRHIKEVLNDSYNYVNIVWNNLSTSKENINTLFELLISKFPGFGGDMFLKRACLFFILLNRMYGVMSEQLNELIVPADYQIPKMLHFYKILRYSPELEETIKNNILIPKGSLMELEIRAATILVCIYLKEICGTNIELIDHYFWSNRYKVQDPFHLTITTDY